MWSCINLITFNSFAYNICTVKCGGKKEPNENE